MGGKVVTKTEIPSVILARLATRVLNVPLMIAPDKLDMILSVIGNRIGLDTSDLDVPEYEMKTRNKTPNEKYISVIPVHGTLVHRTSGMMSLSGLRSYEGIRADFVEAMNDTNSGAVLFDIDSPGGESSGLMDLVDEIYEMRGVKPIYASANSVAFSAAYGIASAAQTVWVPRDGGLGSVGVVALHVDTSKADEQEGIKYTPIYAGKHKVDFSPHSPLGASAKAKVQEIVDDHYKLFTDTVARNRDISVESVRGTEADIFYGDKAVAVGFADEIVSFQDGLVAIIEEVQVSMGGDSSHIIEDVTVGVTSENTAREEVQSMPNLKTFMKENPDAYQELMAEARNEFDSERTQLTQKITDLSQDLKAKDARILKLEKNDAIRSRNELNSRAVSIWDKALSNSEIPEDMWGKVRAMVPFDKHTKDGMLEEESFVEAINAEIEDWENRGVKTTVIGAGYTNRDVSDLETKKHLDQKKADVDEADDLLALAGQVQTKGGES